MSGTVTVSSTTDSQKEVDAAADYGQQTLPLADEEKPGTPSEVEETETAAESEPAEPPENEEEEEGAEEEEPAEPAAAEAPPMGQTRRGLAAQVRRQAARISELEELVRKRAAPPEALSPTAPAPKPDYSQRPDENDPKYVGKLGDFVADMQRHTNWVGEQEKARTEQETAQRQIAQQDERLFADYNRQVDAAKEKYSDWVDTVRPLAEVLPDAAVQAITRLHNGAEVAYRIAKDPDLVQQLVDWGSPDQIRGEGGLDIYSTVRQLSKQLSSPPAPPSSTPRSPQPRPATPRPLRHVGGSATATASSVDPANMDMKDYNAWRDQGGGR